MNFIDFCKSDLFSRSDLYDYYVSKNFSLSMASFNKEFTALIDSHKIKRLGRNIYTMSSKNNAYTYSYSTISNEISNFILNKYPLLSFSIFETVQLNEFVNHQFAHNTIVVYIEQTGVEMIFEDLKELYFGKVLLNPNYDLYHQYWSDNLIVIKKLVTEAPKGLSTSWNTRLEKMLVDIVSDKLLIDLIPESEIQTIFDDATNKYIIDYSCLNRYAKRRKATKKIEKYIILEKDGYNK